jgi:hypothetical protein
VEFAGPNEVMNDQIRFSIDHAALTQSTSPVDFLDALVAANVPSFPLLDSIMNEFIPLDFTNEVPSFCLSSPSIYVQTSQSQMSTCASFLKEQSFDSAGLATQLKERVFDPAELAQEFTDSYSYLTRLYVQMRKEMMVKDPFFRFRVDGELSEDESNRHTARGVVVCEDTKERVTSMEITVADGSSFTVPVYSDCNGNFRRANFDPLYDDDNSPAKYLVAPSFGTEEDRILDRLDVGTFDQQEIDESFSMMDERVMDQTIPKLPPSQSRGSSSSTLPYSKVILVWMSAVLLHFALD